MVRNKGCEWLHAWILWRTWSAKCMKPHSLSLTLSLSLSLSLPLPLRPPPLFHQGLAWGSSEELRWVSSEPTWCGVHLGLEGDSWKGCGDSVQASKSHSTGLYVRLHMQCVCVCLWYLWWRVFSRNCCAVVVLLLHCTNTSLACQLIPRMKHHHAYYQQALKEHIPHAREPLGGGPVLRSTSERFSRF